MISCHKPDAIFLDDNFRVNFKNLIGFAIDFWESDAPAPYFKAGKMQIIKRKAPGWMSLFPWTLELGF